MTEITNTYSTAQLQERRQAKNSQIFRKRLGVVAVTGALAVPAIAAGGARPLAHDVTHAVTNRVEMIKNAFGSNSGEGNVSPQIKQLANDVEAQKAQNQAEYIQAEADQQAAASAASANSAVIEMSQGK